MNFLPHVVYGLLVSLCMSMVNAGELIKVDHKVSEIPAKRSHIQVTNSELHLDGKPTSKDYLIKRLAEIPDATVYCEADKISKIPEVQIQIWASIVIKSGGRFFYKRLRGSIDSHDHCFEYKETSEAGSSNRN